MKLARAIQGTTAVVSVIVAAPVFGPVGTITAAGFTIAAVIGGVAAATEDN
ncbi:hypothetical protein [Vibrio aphrogenes]|uniref:hypothetical protein n=1 Tax=Vibrio aphrogenes TaxID=1891186 RepID=UPI0013E09E2E|nr:hypothetical protein [Vibrio aphrogenes]